MTQKKSKTKKRLGLITSRQLTAATFRAYKAHWGRYMLTVAIVLVPVNILSLSHRLSADAGFNAYTSIASLFMNMALIYMAIRLTTGDDKPTLRQAYYEGTASAVRFIIVMAALLALMIPFAIAGVVSSFASSDYGVSAPLSVQFVVNAAAWLIAFVSLWWLARFGLSMFAVMQDDATPWRALKLSRRLTLRRFWRVLGRMMFMLAMVAATALILSVPIFGLSLVFHNQVILTALYRTPALIIILPFFHLYLLGLYRNLKETAETV